MNRIGSILLLVFFACEGYSLCTNTRNSDRTGGFVNSPFYPWAYTSNTQCSYYIKAPRKHVVAVQFTNFDLQDVVRGNMTDYLKVMDGRKNSEIPPRYFYGSLSPFNFTSTTQRLRLNFVSDYRTNFYGFHATYKFVNIQTHCDTTKLPGNVTSCSDVVNEYATECLASCPTNYSTISGPDATWTCSNGNFTDNTTCLPEAELVKRCEDTDMLDCPFTMNEIIDFYRTNRLPNDANASAEHRAKEEVELDGVPSPVNLGRSGGDLYVCRRKYCRQVFRPWRHYPFKCGRCRDSKRRIACMVCRFQTRCNRNPSPGFFI
ncbi:uncharacterized protein LOC144742436 [Ciona intestinalis]